MSAAASIKVLHCCNTRRLMHVRRYALLVFRFVKDQSEWNKRQPVNDRLGWGVMGTLSEELAGAAAFGSVTAIEIRVLRQALRHALQPTTLQRTDRTKQHTAYASSVRCVAVSLIS
jgi:hypothetical protein